MIVLGIDAAWTENGTSGLAVVVAESERVTYLATSTTCDVLAGWRPGVDAAAVIRSVEKMAGSMPDVVAVDMPLAVGPMVKRRAADDAISRMFGAAGASVHSPALMQPGLADRMRGQFEQAGYRLGVASPGGASLPALIETYPYPIMMQLCGSRRRVPHKASKTLTYWPGVGRAERRLRLRKVWSCIHREMSQRVTISLPDLDEAFDSSFAGIKRHEGALDAVLCTFAGIALARGNAVPYGDAFATIWLPREAEHFREYGLPFEDRLSPATGRRRWLAELPQ